jgi:hypothetical protein
MNASVRRIVTGHGPSGRSVVVSDELVEGAVSWAAQGSAFHTLWGYDSPPVFPDAGRPNVSSGYYPPFGGARFCLVTLGARADGEAPPTVDLREILAEFERLIPGGARYVDPAVSGRHRTPTIDFVVVLAGKLTLTLDDGDVVVLATGDTVVQNGTFHTWTNRGQTPAVMAVVMCGVVHQDVLPTSTGHGA